MSADSSSHNFFDVDCDHVKRPRQPSCSVHSDNHLRVLYTAVSSLRRSIKVYVMGLTGSLL